MSFCICVFIYVVLDCLKCPPELEAEWEAESKRAWDASFPSLKGKHHDS